MTFRHLPQSIFPAQLSSQSHNGPALPTELVSYLRSGPIQIRQKKQICQRAINTDRTRAMLARALH